MQPMPTTAASNQWSSWCSSASGCARVNAAASVGPPARSIRCRRPPAATTSSEWMKSGSGPSPIPEPCVDVEITPAIVWAS